VSGVVTDGPTPAKSSTLVVFPEDPAKRQYPSRYVQLTRSGADGTFRVDGLLDGSYFVGAVPDVSGDLQPEWMASMRPRATPFKISGTAVVSLSLTLIK